MQGIGVDADQAYLGDHIMTSALKKVDEAVVHGRQAGPGRLVQAGHGHGVRRQVRRRRHTARPTPSATKYKDAGRRACWRRSSPARSPTSRPSEQVDLTEQSHPLALELKGVTKRFGALVANDSVDFDLRRGEVHALLGENGAGKSTLMNVLYGLHQPDEGEILLRGEPVHIGSPREAIGMRIGMVHQHFMLIPVMTVAENVVLASEPRKGALLDVDAAERARARAVRALRPRRSTRARASRTSASASSSAWRSCACCTAAPTC